MKVSFFRGCFCCSNILDLIWIWFWLLNRYFLNIVFWELGRKAGGSFRVSG